MLLNELTLQKLNMKFFMWALFWCFLILNKSCSACGTIKLGNRTYYIESDVKTNWFRAYNYCRHHGLQLLSLDGDLTKIDLAEYISNNNTLNRFAFWTSGTDNGSDNEFYWMSTGEKFDYSPSSQRCSNYGRGVYITFSRLNQNAKPTMDTQCCTETLYFICEKTTRSPAINISE